MSFQKLSLCVSDILTDLQLRWFLYYCIFYIKNRDCITVSDRRQKTEGDGIFHEIIFSLRIKLLDIIVNKNRKQAVIQVLYINVALFHHITES